MNIKVGYVQFPYRRFLSDFASGILGYFYIYLSIFVIDCSGTFSLKNFAEHLYQFLIKMPISLQILLLILAIPFGTTINALSWVFFEEAIKFFTYGIFTNYKITYLNLLETYWKYLELLEDILTQGNIYETKNIKRSLKTKYILYSIIDDYLRSSLEKLDTALNNEFAIGLRIMFRNLSFLNLFLGVLLISKDNIKLAFIFLLACVAFYILAVAISIFLFTERIRTFITLISKDFKYRKEFKTFLYFLRRNQLL